MLGVHQLSIPIEAIFLKAVAQCLTQFQYVELNILSVSIVIYLRKTPLISIY